MPSWDKFQVREPHARKALVGGLIATIVLTGLMYLGPAVGLHIWNVPAMVGGAMSFDEMVTPARTPGIYGVAFFVYLVFTIFVAPLCYAYWCYSYLFGSTWMRGLLYGGLLWLLTQIFLMPLIGQGAFDMRGPGTGIEIFSQLVLWVVYGVLLGIISGPQQVWHQRPHPEQHA